MSTDIYSIYTAYCKITDLYYVGFTKYFKKRKERHFHMSLNEKYKKYRNYWCEFHKTIREYGWESFEWNIIYQSKNKKHTSKFMENHFIKEYNSYYKWENGGYNMTLGGEGMNGTKWTEERRIQAKINNTGSKKSCVW